MDFIHNINNNFKRLCNDVIVFIFSYLSSNNKLYLCNYEYLYSDIYNLKLVNKEFYKIIKNNFKITTDNIHKEYWYQYNIFLSFYIDKKYLCKKCNIIDEKYRNNIKIILDEINHLNSPNPYQNAFSHKLIYIHNDSFDKQLINDILQKYIKNIEFSHYCCSGSGVAFLLK